MPNTQSLSDSSHRHRTRHTAGYESGRSRRGCPSCGRAGRASDGFRLQPASAPSRRAPSRRSPGVTSFFLFLGLAAAASPACTVDSGLPTSCGTTIPFRPRRNKALSLKASQPHTAGDTGVSLPPPHAGACLLRDLPARPKHPQGNPKALSALQTRCFWGGDGDTETSGDFNSLA